MSAVSGIARMNIAAMDDEDLRLLRAEVLAAHDAGENAEDLLDALDGEIELRTREPLL